MFEYYGENEKIGVYLDYSNMHYTKYNLGWDYNISQFINICLSDNRITRLALYGAYDPKNLSQYNWIQKLKTRFQGPKNYFFFKKLETKGGKNKGNVDTEMGFDIAQDLNNNLWDCIILFTGDGDFLYPIQKIIDFGKRVTVISTKGHIAKELIDFINVQDDTVCRYINIHKETSLSNPIRQALRDTSRGISLHPDLLQYIKDSDQEDIKELISWTKEVVAGNVEQANTPIFLKENEMVRKIIIRRHIQEKQEFLTYLETLL